MVWWEKCASIPGPQMRGTGGTLSGVWKGRRGRSYQSIATEGEEVKLPRLLIANALALHALQDYSPPRWVRGEKVHLPSPVPKCEGPGTLSVVWKDHRDRGHRPRQVKREREPAPATSGAPAIALLLVYRMVPMRPTLVDSTAECLLPTVWFDSAVPH